MSKYKTINGILTNDYSDRFANYQISIGKYGKITWEAHLRAYAIYSADGHGDQSAERISERMGFGVNELDVYYPEWRNHIL